MKDCICKTSGDLWGHRLVLERDCPVHGDGKTERGPRADYTIRDEININTMPGAE